MFSSTPAIHPMHVAANPAQQQPPPGVLMGSLPGMAGTPSGLFLRATQVILSAASFAVMASTSGFASVYAFIFLVAAGIVQCVWSLFVAILDIYALLVKRSLRKRWLFTLLATGDMITFLGMISGAGASAGITVYLDNDLNICSVNHCPGFKTAVGLGFICSFSIATSFLLNRWAAAYYSRVLAA